MKKLLFTAALMIAATVQSFAQYPLNNVWTRVNVYPAGSGQVFIDWNIDEVVYQPVFSEFKRSTNAAASNAFLKVKAANGYQYAGLARDMNNNGQYDNDYQVDRLVHVWSNGYFTCFYDHTDYLVPGSNSDTEDLAKEALDAMTAPTDQLFAVFTQGDVARRAPGEEAHGYVFASKLDNTTGDQVTFFAYGDSESTDDGNIYYKFDHWSDADGNEVSKDREFTVTVQGGKIYYAHFATTTKADNKENEKLPDWFKYDYNNKDWNPTGIETVKNCNVANAAMYDLQGRRVAQPAKGIFIQNGKKIVKK